MAAETTGPPVTIVVPAHNCSALTVACLDSIRAHTLCDYEVVLVDDASEPECAATFASRADAHCRVIRNDSRRSYSENNNLAARATEAPYLCLLNNDTRVTPGWLRAMLRVMEQDPGIGVLGNKHLFPDSNLLHHCGIAFDARGYPVHLNPGTDPDAYAVNLQRDLQCVTFACVLIPRAVYDELGGLDEGYRNGFEDCDFCMRAGDAGYRVTYTPASTIYHHGQATPGRTDFEDANWRRFEARWGSRTERNLKTLAREDRRLSRQEAYRQRGRTRADGFHFAMDLGYGSAFTWATAELIRELTAMGESVSVAPSRSLHAAIEGEQRKLLRRLMRRAPRQTFHVKWSHYWAGCLKQPLAGDVNVEFFCTNYGYRPDARLDLWSRRVRVSSSRLLPVGRFNTRVLGEIGVPEDRCEMIPLGYAPEIDALYPQGRPPRPAGGDLHLLVVTNAHDLERYGTDILVEALDRAFGPDDPVVVHVKDYGAGSDNSALARWIEQRPQFPRVVWHREFLSKADLVRLYAGMDAMLAPFRGEGFGMKILDAMALGLPVLMPAFGGPTEFAPGGTFVPLAFREVPVGDCYDRRNAYLGEGAYWCEVEVPYFASQLRALAGNPASARAVGAAAREHVRPSYSWPAVARRFVDVLRGWQTDRDVTVSARRCHPGKAVSVVIPTRDRNEILRRALAGYAQQTLRRDRFDLVLVNDHGDSESVRQAAADAGTGLDITVIDNAGVEGPAAARNLGIEAARGDIVLITGDDIVPGERFVEAHLDMHRHHREGTTAVLGRTDWHPDLEPTPFMAHLTGLGGHQFNYRGLRDGGPALYDRFYTSNVSLKRSFLIEEATLFSTQFDAAAYEDIELAYRLHLRGMQLRYSATALGCHLHAMDPAGFLRRQVRVGRMLSLLSLVQPAYVPDEHAVFLRMLEFGRHNPELQDALLNNGESTFEGELVEALTEAFDRFLGLTATLDTPDRSDIVGHDASVLKAWIEASSGTVWDAINELALRRGMAEGWAGNEREERWAGRLALLIALPAALSMGQHAFWPHMAAARPLRIDRLPGARLLVAAVQRGRMHPRLGPWLTRLERSRWGRTLCMRLTG